MSAVIVTIISVGGLLAGIILYGQIVNRDEIKALREEMREQFSQLREKIDANNEI